MRVFVTGASGFVGSVVVKDLIRRGHEVTGLARSAQSADLLTALGAQVLRGDLGDLESLKAGASAAEGVIHTAFQHGTNMTPESFAASCETDRIAIETLGAALIGTERPLIVTSGTSVAPGRIIDEDETPVANPRIPRVSDATTLALASKGVRAMLIGLPRSVHGEGDYHGFIPRLIALARTKGVSAYIGDGANRWPAVHRLDAAHLYTLALERGQKGARYFAVGDEALSLRKIAEVIGERLGVPTASLTTEEASTHFGPFLAMVVGVDCPATSKKTQERLAWKLEQPGLLEDLRLAHYFENAK